jgi:hypothetical protein
MISVGVLQLQGHAEVIWHSFGSLASDEKHERGCDLAWRLEE